MSYGFSALNKSFNSRQTNSTDALNANKLDSLIIAVRVNYILLDDSDRTKFEKYGGCNYSYQTK